MGDFDFEENLSKFDKQSVFRKIKERDTTASEARLVNFNRRRGHNISTDSGRKNLLHTENVLDLPTITQDKWSSETGETEAESSDNNFRRASLTLRRTVSSQSQQQRHRHDKTSAMVGPADRDTSPTTQSETPSGPGQGSAAQPGSGKQGRVSPTNSVTPKAMAVAKSGLYLAGSQQPCPIVSPVQMLEIERLALVELGLTEDMMTENAARGIAELAFRMLAGTGRRRSHQYHHAPHNGSLVPFVVVLAGHHLDGIRAIAGARHLRNHGVKVVVYVLGLKKDDANVSEGMRRQLAILQQSGGKLVYPDGAVAKSLGKLPAPDLIVDALFGITTSFGILERPDQSAAQAFLAWANGAGINILSVDVPMGIDACTGIVDISTHSRAFL
jgi:enhancer of mRNA-decapping protein 3